MYVCVYIYTSQNFYCYTFSALNFAFTTPAKTILPLVNPIHSSFILRNHPALSALQLQGSSLIYDQEREGERECVCIEIFTVCVRVFETVHIYLHFALEQMKIFFHFLDLSSSTYLLLQNPETLNLHASTLSTSYLRLLT